MATTTTGRPGRTLIVLAVLVAGLITLLAVSNTWAPKLGLDLRGGTTITLTAANTSGTGSVDPNSLALAQTIIKNRVDSLGVGESEVTTAGDNQIVVTVPNVQQDELVRLVGQTALLRFRAVYAAEQVAPPVAPTPEPTPTASESVNSPPDPSASPTTAGSPVSDHGRKPESDHGGECGALRQQQADARSAHRASPADRRGVRVLRRPAHPARPGGGLAAQ